MCKRTKLLAIEVEAEMQKAREARTIDGDLVPFSGGLEKSQIADAIKIGKTTGKIGDKTLLAINPLYIHMPEWQREVRLAKALSIGNNYNPSEWDVPKVYLFKGKLYCGDGQHRIYGAWKAGIEMVVVELLEITEDEAMDLFLKQTKHRTEMCQADYLNAAIGRKIPEYLTFKKICNGNNIKIKGYTNDEVDNPIGIWTSISDGLKLSRSNPKLMEDIVKLIGNLQWNGANYKEGKAYSARIVRVLGKMYAYYKDSSKEMEEILIRRCKGAEYFNNKIARLSQDQLFDYLSDIIGIELQMEEVPTYNGKVVRRIRKTS